MAARIIKESRGVTRGSGDGWVDFANPEGYICMVFLFFFFFCFIPEGRLYTFVLFTETPVV